MALKFGVYVPSGKLDFSKTANDLPFEKNQVSFGKYGLYKIKNKIE